MFYGVDMSTRGAAGALGACLILLVGVIAASPASAGTRAIEEGWVVPFPESVLTSVYNDFLVSGDLSTAVTSRCYNGGQGGVAFVDLATGTESTITGAPERCGSTSPWGDPDPPYGTSVHAIAHDGTALVSASWEGIEPGDEDGGQLDVFLIRPDTGEIELISGGLDLTWILGTAISDDGTRAIFRPSDGDTTHPFYLWDNGVVREVAGDAGEPTFDPRLPKISGDGRFLFVSVSVEFLETGQLARVDLDSGEIVTIDFTPTCCGLEHYAVSKDGSKVAWVGPGEEFDDLFSPKVTVVDLADPETPTSQVFTLHDGPLQSQPIHLTDDGSKVIGSSRYFNPGGGASGYTAWSLDIATGRLTHFVDERPGGGPWLVVDAISANADKAVISTMGPVGFEPASPRVVDGGRIATRQYLWDSALTPPPHPGTDATIAAQIQRLYLAFFNRASDPEGQSFWVGWLIHTGDLDLIAEQFASSEEFQLRYGELDDEGFVDLLYNNVFDRVPDAEGAQFWLDQLASGATRAEIMAAVSESPEFIARTKTRAPVSADEIALKRLYAAYFLRDADDAGLRYWLGQIQAGTTMEDVSEAFAATTEFASSYGELEDHGYLTMVYLNVLGRHPDPDGQAHWMARLASGTSRGEVMLAFSESLEFVTTTTQRQP